ncbi:DegV family protein [Lederbergia citrea]|uniref:DegV family protein n=1 Tax=Lederbergia citrea TaxID=2833581 RepID=A0A942USI7_9BACI|nr:DegV family protein [Lederbergia citrea]MBS4178266.1 DegV family protein [Lederbergia citrea]MBS4223204.1 DegV family protein [Lederbergia citrea]
MKTAVVTDSTSYIPKHIRENLDIYMIPLNVIINGEPYKEEIDISAPDFYEEVRNGSELPTTSQPPIGEFEELYSQLAKEYDAIISIHLSSGISGTYQGAVAAAEMAENVKIYTYDSEISCMPQGFYVLEAAWMAQQGNGPEEILPRLDELKAAMKAYFMVDDLSHLQRGGRLSSAQAIIGGLLNIKPVLHFENKVIVPFEKIRTRKKALKRIQEMLGEDVDKGMRLKATIIHANRVQEAAEWKSELEALYPTVEFSISYFGPVIGTHLGEGAMGLGWTVK